MKAKKYTKGGFSHYTVCYRAASGDYSYAENMYIDPEGDADVLESIPGCRRLYTFESRINGIFKQGESIIVHAGERLYRFKEDERDGLTKLSPLLSMKNEKSVGACLDGRLLISDGESLVLIDGDGAQRIESADDSLKEELLAFDNKSISLCDDILFLCPEGLVNGRGELLSESINRLLLPKIDSAELCLWQGYITVFSGDRIFLCRMREGKPIWFTVSGVGSYGKDKRLYRYSPEAAEGFLIHSHTDGAAEGEIMSVGKEDGGLIYYAERDGEKYTVYPTEERVGGDFFPATRYLVSGRLLYFGTDSGDLCIFNNDKRGVPPSRIKNTEGFDSEDYKAAFGELIHPDFYSFLGHRVRYLLTTVTEDVGMSAARKINVKGSLTLKYKSYPRSELAVTVISDGGVSREAFTVGGSGSSFAELDFSDFCPEDSGCRSLSLPEKNPCFKEKQIVISGEKFCSPIGIISLEYGCKIRR